MHYNTLIVVIEADDEPEGDFISVIECRTYDSEGEEIVAGPATDALVGIHTCKDQGDDIEPALQQQVDVALAANGITYRAMEFLQE